MGYNYQFALWLLGNTRDCVVMLNLSLCMSICVVQLFMMLVGVVKCISSDYHLKWLAVGSSNDIISTLDPRTGEVFASWKTSEFSVSGDNIYTLVITNILYSLVCGRPTHTHMRQTVYYR